MLHAHPSSFINNKSNNARPLRGQLEAERAKLFDQVNEGRQRLQALSRRLLKVQEVERRELARDLHDEIGQALTALKVNLQGCQRLRKGSAALSLMRDSVQIVDRMLHAVRNLALDLRPSLLDHCGLGPALRWYLKRQAIRFNWKVECVGEAVRKRYHEDLEIACFRVAQEAVTNIGRHARATRVRVSVNERNGILELHVKDNGIGFNPSRALARANKGKSLGLVGMGERARLVNGKVTVVSSPGVGTIVHASFPVSQDRQIERRMVPR
jgi:signal transduction histidine kinase